MKKCNLYKIEKYLHEQQIGENKWFEFNLLNFNYFISEEEKFSDLNIKDLDGETLTVLKNLKFLLPIKEENYFKELIDNWISNFKINYKKTPDTIKITIFPTLGCNFRCIYCYQPEIYGGETRKQTELYIEEEYIKYFFDHVMKDSKFKDKIIEFNICGGEVFLDDLRAFNFIKYLLKQNESFNIKEIQFTTNGYNIDLFFDILKEFENISYAITIDGPKHIHDKRRILADGKGSYEKIISNIERILNETTQKVMIRTNFDDENVSHYPTFINNLKDKGLLKYSNLTFYFRNVAGYISEENKQKQNIQNSHYNLSSLKLVQPQSYSKLTKIESSISFCLI